MKDNKRNFLKLSITGAVIVLPQVWKKPIVNSVILPSHASTSVGVCCLLPEVATSSCENGISQNIVSFENFGPTFEALNASSSGATQTIATEPPLPAVLENGDALIITITENGVDCNSQQNISSAVLTINTNDSNTATFLFQLPVQQP